ncbi:hypothetical protein SEUCBS140593_009660 [Sporothrix eucalyptigena]|uniref:Uncharacterized protein n=1 Tax=Sporothrix eucalyptigena TaxID=1812306 RepID=A0ABP0CWV2_9PEZI
MLRGRIALRHAIRRAQLPLQVSSPPLVFIFRRHRFASSNSAGSSDASRPKKPAPSPAFPANPAPSSAVSNSLPGAGANPQEQPREQSQELAEIQSRLDSPYSLKPGSPWGYAVVRTVYGPGTEAPWRHILELLAESARDTCAFYANAGDLHDRHVLTPIEDAEHLNAASSHTVRSVFKQWAAAEKQAWTAQPDMSPGMPDVFFGTRYNFCLYFDRACLESLEHEQPQPVIKLLVKDWQPAEPLHNNSSSPTDPPGHWEDGVTNEAEEDVGWMYIDLNGYVDTYGQLDDPDWWHELYVRAPDQHPIFAGPRRKGDL